ncbi:MAG: hypothetical protein QHH18_05265 [Candidatus Bathyarchaeota archaeon]|nr:hypothetical protein [Candidatus Bathyarchaeota archaeon A05DMB-5]MDH7557998.1 hypothetical protein [Candidatus Bathyarchaeota archaeon]
MNTKITFSESGERKIDVFTDKAPFDGRGLNQSSDAYQPQELLILYALVTYNENPLSNKLVGFQVRNPINAFQNITITGTCASNESGIATFLFRIPWPSENGEEIIFGVWSVIATVDIAGSMVLDTLTFKVGWIIEITEISTLNTRLEPITSCSQGETIVFNLTIQNIALTPKIATIAVDMQDIANYPILHIQNDDVFEHGKSYTYVTSHVPLTAMIGEATIYAVAFTAPLDIGGVPYCPTISTKLTITPQKQYYLAVRTNPPNIVTISGEGWYNEGSNVNLVAPEHVSITTNTRYKFVCWDVDGIFNATNSITVIMNSNHTVTAHYIVQYYLTVNMVPSGIVMILGEGWYDQFENVSLTAPVVEGYDFDYWKVDETTQIAGTRTITVFMNAPHNATAYYHSIAAGAYFPWWALFWYLLFPLALILIILLALLYRRRKKKKEDTFYRGWTAWYYCYDLRKRIR